MSTPHGRQGLAPANRLQILAEAPTDRPRPPFLKGLDNAPAISQETYEVPALLNPSSPVSADEELGGGGPTPQSQFTKSLTHLPVPESSVKDPKLSKTGKYISRQKKIDQKVGSTQGLNILGVCVHQGEQTYRMGTSQLG